MGQPACLKKITSVRGRGRLARRAQASKAPTGPSFVRSNNDHKDPLWSNKPGPFKAFSESGLPKIPLRPSQAPPL